MLYSSHGQSRKRRRENMSKTSMRGAAAGIVAALAFTVLSTHSQTSQLQIPKPVQVGPAPDGSFLLNTGWSLQPAGRTIPLSHYQCLRQLHRTGAELRYSRGDFCPLPWIILIWRPQVRLPLFPLPTDGVDWHFQVPEQSCMPGMGRTQVSLNLR
jgi:hypothetical protein